MPALMKKRPIVQQIRIVLHGPINQKNKFLNAAKQFQFREETASIPALDALSKYVDLDQLPGISLRVHRENAKLTQKALAEKISVKQHHISEMENSKRPIGKELAKKIATVLGTDYREYL